MGLNFFFNKKENLTLDSGEKYPWKKGTELEATEKSAFIIPGGLFENGKAINEMMELSDDETEIIAMTEQSETTYPDIAVILKAGVSLKLNKNSEVIHVHLQGEEKRKKIFVVKN